MALMEISVVPLGTASTSLSHYVAKVCDVLIELNVDYKLTDMGTIICCDIDKAFEIARRLHEVPFEQGAKRVVTTLKIDDRRDKEVRLDQKIKSVEEKLKKK